MTETTRPDWPIRGTEGPAVLLLTENRGISPYMSDVADDLARAGYRVMVPDLLWRLGGTASFEHDPSSVSTREVDHATQVADIVAAYDEWTADAGAVAVVGFCFGAEMGWELLARRDVDVAVLHYGIAPDPAAVAARTGSIFATYAYDDPRVNDTLADLVVALGSGTCDYTLESYPGTRHAFHDHHRPSRHDPAAARVLWDRTLAFLRSHLASDR